MEDFPTTHDFPDTHAPGYMLITDARDADYQVP